MTISVKVLLTAGAITACASALAQLEKPLTQEDHIRCGGVAMAGLAMTPEKDRAPMRRMLTYFLTAASTLDPSRGVQEATTSANRAMFEGSKQWIDSVVGRKGKEEEWRDALNRFKDETNRCVAVLLAHERGISESKP